VIVVAKTSNGIKVVGSRSIATRLPPRDTFVQIPLDMQSALYGKVTVQVMAGNVVVSKQTVTVRRSYLDRLALIGGIVVVLGGMLLWIVARVRRSPDVDADEAFGSEEDDTDADDASHDADTQARYTDSTLTNSTKRDS
jgi:type VI protein secretion system component VasK